MEKQDSSYLRYLRVFFFMVSLPPLLLLLLKVLLGFSARARRTGVSALPSGTLSAQKLDIAKCAMSKVRLTSTPLDTEHPWGAGYNLLAGQNTRETKWTLSTTAGSANCADGCVCTAHLTSEHICAVPKHTEPRDFVPNLGYGHDVIKDNRHDAEPVVTVESPEHNLACGTDIEYDESVSTPTVISGNRRSISGDSEDPDVPFSVQSWLFESLAEVELDKLHDLIDDNHDLILEMARDRFRKGYAKYGSAMYSWSPERRLDETLQELADAVVYPTSGTLE